MKLKLKLLILFLTLFVVLPNAQEITQDTNLYVIQKNDGNEYIGKILNDDGREVLIFTDKLGKIYIPKSDIKSITLVDKEKDFVNNEYQGKGVFTTRYQFSTNSFPIEKGENYAMVNLYGPEVHFNVTNKFSIGVMATWIASPLVLALKYTIPTKNEKLNFGLGTLMGASGYLDRGRSYGALHWGMVTYGTRKNNITVSAGISYFCRNYKQTFNVPGIYPAIEVSPDYWQFDYSSPTFTQKVSPIIAPAIGIAGIASVGKKASFICDALLLIGQQKVSGQKTEYFYDQTVAYQPSYTSIDPVITENQQSINLILMPGMRFQKTENKAFQVSLAGIIGRNGSSSYSVPVPMLSWFFKF